MNDSDLLSLEILPLSKIKATLSEQVNKTQGGTRIAITINGFPRAILLSYSDFLDLLRKPGSPTSPTRTIRYESWKAAEPQRLLARDSILGLFDMKKLARKGKKTDKKKNSKP